MKEFIVKHPFITLFIVDTIVCGVVNIVTVLKTGEPGFKFEVGVNPKKAEKGE